MQNESDTLPFINRFNYLVKEITFEEFLKVLSQREENEEQLNKNESSQNNMIVCH